VSGSVCTKPTKWPLVKALNWKVCPGGHNSDYTIHRTATTPQKTAGDWEQLGERIQKLFGGESHVPQRTPKDKFAPITFTMAEDLKTNVVGHAPISNHSQHVATNFDLKTCTR